MIENVSTGQRIPTTVEPIERADLDALGKGWRFGWTEILKNAEVFKLIDPLAPDRVFGLIGLKRCERYVEVTHLESNPIDVGRTKTLRGIAGSLLAFAAQLSFEIGGDGFVAMDAKTELIDHYRETYGFERVGSSQRVILGKLAAANLILLYGGEPIHE